MDAMQERLNKLREERLAREKARIEKLRELNLKKYNKNDIQPRNTPNISVANKTTRSDIKPKIRNPVKSIDKITKRPMTAPMTNKTDTVMSKVTANTNKVDIKTNHNPKKLTSPKKVDNEKKSNNNATKATKKPENALKEKRLGDSTVVSKSTSNFDRKSSVDAKPKTNHGKTTDGNKNPNFINKRHTVFNFNSRKSSAVETKPQQSIARKSFIPKPPQSATKPTNNISVFERLYNSKTIQKSRTNHVEKLQTDPKYLEKVIRTTGLILNKRYSVFEPKAQIAVPVRRSISAVHFKRINKQELSNCVHKWASIGDNLNKAHLKHINEDESIKEDKLVSAIKSERKKVKFMTPIQNLNTPKPEELQARLKSWLQKRGKSLDSYHHLQCFGIHHLPQPIRFDMKPYDDENKENIAVESDSDNESYTETMNDDKNVKKNDKWRRVSSVCDSFVDFNESQNTTMTGSSDVNLNTDEVVIGALNDLTELLKEGFEWEQCARWLRAIRERFPSAPNSAAYWECRAALEERRGDLPASVQCWEEAIVKGTEHSVVEANLDQLLDKFMQLKISPNSGKQRQVDPKLVDVKNVFKSTIIRFAVQQAKLRQSNQFEVPKYTVTPVRRSARLSAHWSGKRTPLQVCTTVRQAELLAEKPVFVPNGSLYGTP